MSDETTWRIPVFLFLLVTAGFLFGLLYGNRIQPPTESCHRTVPECEAFCTPRGGVARVTLPVLYRCPQSRSVLCTCRRS